MGWTDDPEERREIAELYGALGTIRAVSKATGHGHMAIAKALRMEGVRLNMGMKSKLDDKACREAARLYREGWSTRDLGHVYSVDRSTISVALKRHGVKLRPRGGQRYEERS